jgi:plasmid stabilization system protein ParE
MGFSVKLTSLAEEDAYQAFEYIRKDDLERAEEWLIGLFQKIQTLVDMPHRYTVIPESRTLGKEIRQLRYGRYRILYDIHESKEEVRILRIWHSARDAVSTDDIT